MNSTVLTFGNVAQSFLFIPHYHLVFRNQIVPILIPGWSLNYEMLFYVVFAGGLLLPAQRVWLLTIIGALAALAGSGFWLTPHNAIAVEVTNPKLLMFAWGIGLAVAYLRGTRIRGLSGIIMLMMGLLLFVLTTRAGALPLMLDQSGVAPLLIVTGSLALEPMARKISSGFLKLMGDASYALYLSHPFALKVPELIWKRLHLFGSLTSDLIYFTVCLVSAAALGIGVHWWIEQPILRWLRDRSASSRVSAERAIPA
jgi:exopolysaccharide production protein ExoZ